jgi:hypothetical protein
MDFNELVNKFNWKKTAVVALIVVSAFWVIREIIFLEFVHSLHKVYSQFVTQFNDDQQSIHRIIEEHHEKQIAMSKEMDKRDREFHEYVDRSINDTLAFLNKERPSADHQPTTEEKEDAVKNDRLKKSGV